MKGFTLIEVLIALAIFAILSTLTAVSMSNAFKTRTRVNAQMNRLAEIDLSISHLQRDINQITNRAVREKIINLKPAFIGQTYYMEFTRSGYINPKAVEKRSTLKRIALLCDKNKLIRRAFVGLDASKTNTFEDKTLLTNLRHCEFQYLSPSGQWYDQWINISNNPKASILPKAVQVLFTLNDWGKMSLAFIIPEGLYASVK